MADIVLIIPRYGVSYWGMEYALPLLGKRATVPTASLPLIAALTPKTHSVTLIDENVEKIDFDRCSRADIVGLTGLIVQRNRMTQILTELKRRNLFTVVGGPWVTVQEDYFGDLADVVFVGEAEETWPRFLTEWRDHRHSRRYEPKVATDMTAVPIPRFDLLKLEHYLLGSVQFSRGCPFQCEFCDIIVTFGRRPRFKTSDQVIAELDALRKQGMRTVFIVDDNFVGNKKQVKLLLKDIIAWQKLHEFPMNFFTEASIDLADDSELMELMVAANIDDVFIGIESPNEESLRETKKFQNLRKGGTLVEKVHRIQKAGMEVWCGMIVGFDHDGPEIFGAQAEFLKQARIINASVGMLYAIPKTPLYDRLAAEGRLNFDDELQIGTNVRPLHIAPQELRDGYLTLNRQLYSFEDYFGRFEDLYYNEQLLYKRGGDVFLRAHPWRSFRKRLRLLIEAAILFTRLLHGVSEASLRREYLNRLRGLLKNRRDSRMVWVFVLKCIRHYHIHTMFEEMSLGRTHVHNTY